MGVAFRLGQVAVVLAAAVAATTGCGDSKSNDGKSGASPAGSSGSTATAGSSASGGSAAGSNAVGGNGGSGGSSGGKSGSGLLPLGDSATEGCIAYAYAVCQRGYTCRNAVAGSSNCLRVTFSCPDLTGSEGSTRTAEILKTCGETFDALACEEVARDVRPSCITKGTLAVGAKCVYASQCSTLNCEYPPTGSCGQCATEANVGEDCSSPTVDCGAGSVCGDGKTCRSYVDEPAQLNEPCGADAASCAADAYCAGGVCTKRSAVGEPCSFSVPCDATGYCTGSMCQALPGVGQPCGIDPSFTTEGNCAPGTVCDWDSATMSGTCVKLPKLGDPCYRPDYRPDSYICDSANGLHCDTAVTPHVCRGFNQPGEPCQFDSDCDGTQAVCECPDMSEECEAPICRKVQFEGQPCTDPSTMCHPGFACEGGTCKLRPLQGIFADSCGPL